MATARKTARRPAAKKAASTAKPAPTRAAKPPTKTAAKPRPQPAPAPVTAPAKAPPVPAAAVPAKADKTPKAEKPKKPKLVRDSFTIPKAEYLVLQALKARAEKLGRGAKKSELLRAGVKVLAGMSDADFIAGLRAVPALKTGRPMKA